MSKEKDIEQLAKDILGNAKAKRILTKRLSEGELKEAPYTKEDREDDDAIQLVVDDFFSIKKNKIIRKGKAKAQLAKVSR